MSTAAEPRPFRLESPYGLWAELSSRQRGAWYHGDLHTHSAHSHDGAYPPELLVDMFRAHAFDFVAITDHPKPGQHRTLDLSAAAEASTRWGSGLPWPASDGLIVVPGYEYETPPPDLAHTNCIGRPGRDLTIYDGANGTQGAVDQANADGGWTFFCHPNVFGRADLIDGVRDLVGIEVINAGSVSYRAGREDALVRGLAFDAWDRALARGQRLWGFANSDFHRFLEGEPFVARNVVYAAERTWDAIESSIRRGCFYFSTGQSIDRIDVAGDELAIRAPGAERIRFVGRGGVVLGEAAGEQAAYRVRGDEGYVRAEAEGPGSAFRTRPQLRDLAPTAYTQPVFVRPEGASAREPRHA